MPGGESELEYSMTLDEDALTAKLDKLQSQIPATSFSVGSQILANFHGEGQLFPGVIAAANANGTFEIDYDDGDQEHGVQPGMLQLQKSRAKAPHREPRSATASGSTTPS